MPTHPLPYRINDYLQRQIAWAEAVIGELDAFCALSDDADFGDAAARQQQREKETQAMAREYNGLAHEWARAMHISPEDRAAIVQRSDEARRLMDELQRRYVAAEQSVQARKVRNREALNDLRRGRRSVNIYKPGILVSPGFIDKEA